MRVVILCGGQGTRAWPATAEVPKPMLEIGGLPVLYHVMEIYARQGFCDFMLATGYKGGAIADWARSLTNGWSVECVDTGERADTGDRLRACAKVIGQPFLATYGDGLGNVDLRALLGVHRARQALATMTTVPLPSQYGTVITDPDGRITGFSEKPLLRDHWINAGFFVLDAATIAELPGASLERDMLPALGDSQRLYAYRHDGFWKSMDTHKDVLELNRLAEEEGHPWLRIPTS